MFRVRTASLLVLILAVLLGALLVLGRDRSFQGVPLAPAPAPDFALSAPYRGPVTLADYRGDAVLVTFGRPSCGTACNPQLPALRDALNRLGDRRADVRVLYVTLEPDSMNEQQLLAFVQDHDLGFTGLRGTAANAGETAVAYGAAFGAVPDSVRAGTDSARVFGIDRDGVLRVAWDAEDPAAMARDIRTLLRF